MNLLLHATTKESIANFLVRPNHALLLVGSEGVGKTAVAEALVADILKLPPEKIAAYPYFKRIAAEKDSISIEAVRELQKFLQLKTLGDAPFRRVIIVEHAEKLTVEAQNAYLKLLEEPPADTLMILTANNPRALLPTIRSRVQSITVQQPNPDELKDFFRPQVADEQALTQAFFLSGGMPGLMTALLADDTSHPLVQGVAQAKQILQKQTFERLAMVEGLSKQKELAQYTLTALQHIAQTGLNQAATKEDGAKIKQWHRILKVTTDGLQALRQSANTKLVLSNLMLQI